MRSRGIVAGLSAIALASLLVASPASAATLPLGQKITVVNWDSAGVGADTQQMFEPSPATAIAATVGLSQSSTSVSAIDVNDDGFGYALSFLRLQGAFVPALFNANANTGQLSGGVAIVPAPSLDISIDSCRALDLQPNGEVLTACMDLVPAFVNSYIGVVDPATGYFTPFVSNGGVQQNPNVYWSALAYNAVTGELWAFGENRHFVAHLVDRAAGSLGPPITSDSVYGADFDRDGQLFVMTFGKILRTVVPATGTVTDIAEVTNADVEMSVVEAITVWGKTLPATGPAEVVPIGIGTALLFVAGVAFIATSRMERRTR